MRPLAVLLLVLVAVCALVFAFVTLGGSDENGTDTVARPPGAPEVVAERGPAAALVEGGERVEAAPEQRRERTEVATEARGAFDNALHGVVSDEAGAPIAGARVELHRRSGPANLAALTRVLGNDTEELLRRGETDDEGKFRFARLEPRADYLLVVDHDDYQRTEAGPIEVGERDDVRRDVELGEGYLLFGYVRDHDTGLVVEDAQVTLDDPVLAQLPGHRASPDRRTARTGADGRYEFRHVTPGTKYLMVTAEGYGTVVDNQVRFEPKVDHLSRDFRLKPELTISGRVVSPDRRGIPGASVEVISYNADNMSRGGAVAGEDGAFVVRGLAEAQYTLIARAEGWGEERLSRINAGDTGVLVEMPQPGGVMGRVVDAGSGRGLESFQVSVRMVNREGTYVGRAAAARSVRGAQNGAYHVQGLAAGSYVVEAEAEGYATGRSEPFQLEQGMTVPDVVVPMGRGGSIVGRVIDSYSGEPVVGARVVTQDNNWVESPFTNLFKGLSARLTTEASARTDADGRFELELLMPETYQLQVEHPSYTKLVRKDLAVFEGRPTDVGELRMTHGARISGRVYRADGTPLVGGQVMLNSSVGDGRSYEVRTGAEGRYALRNVVPGSYKISASRPNVGTENPFQVIVDMKHSEIEMSVIDGGEYTQDLYLGSD